MARWWLHHPDAIPRPPESFSIWLLDLYGAKNAEDVSNAEILFSLGVSLIVVTLLTLFVRFVWQRYGRRENKSGR